MEGCMAADKIYGTYSDIGMWYFLNTDAHTAAHPQLEKKLVMCVQKTLFILFFASNSRFIQTKS